MMTLQPRRLSSQQNATSDIEARRWASPRCRSCVATAVIARQSAGRMVLVNRNNNVRTVAAELACDCVVYLLDSVSTHL